MQFSRRILVKFEEKLFQFCVKRFWLGRKNMTIFTLLPTILNDQSFSYLPYLYDVVFYLMFIFPLNSVIQSKGNSWYFTLSGHHHSLVLFMVFNATFNYISVISWRSVLLVEETGVPGENHRPVTNLWQTLSHNEIISDNSQQ